MLYRDTRDSSVQVSFREAVMRGMNPATGGLYFPVSIPKLPAPFMGKNPPPSFRDTAFAAARPFLEGEMPDGDLMAIIADAYPFSAPVKPVDPVTYVLELFHGPTCAFKDFGARFMARVMRFFNQDEDRSLHILVATSGDTGSAVGSAFYGVEGIDVTILYPAGKISPLQEKQLSTFDGNVRSLSVEGTFDDCQKLVKTAFTDADLRKRFRLSSANSINIARLLPQAFYYIYGALAVMGRSKRDNHIECPQLLAVVPSGNFGNLTSGLIAREMGAPIAGFVAATNANRTVPDWLETGEYKPRPSVLTLSNAMDVGAPSNFERMRAMYSLEEARKILAGFWVSDSETLESIRSCYDSTGYILDPHGAVGWKAWQEIRSGAMAGVLAGESLLPEKTGLRCTAETAPDWADACVKGNCLAMILETAHPAKFSPIVQRAGCREPVMPDRLERVLSLPDRSVPMSADYGAFRDWLEANL